MANNRRIVRKYKPATRATFDDYQWPVNMALVVLGGAMDFGGHESALGREFLETIRQQVSERTFPVIAEQVTIDFASLGEAAGYIGSAGLGRALVKEA